MVVIWRRQVLAVHQLIVSVLLAERALGFTLSLIDALLYDRIASGSRYLFFFHLDAISANTTPKTKKRLKELEMAIQFIRDFKKLK